MKNARICSIILIAFGLLFLFEIPASADMGPKPSITVTVVNAPEEYYLVDLLMYGRGYNMTDAELERYSGKEREMLDTLIAYRSDDGMTARIGSVLGTEFSWTKSGETYRFGYNNVPDTFQVILVNESGTVTLSQVYHRKSYNSVVTFDASNGEIREYLWGYAATYLVRFTVTLTCTLIIEGIIFLLFKYRFRDGKNGKVFLLTNLGTQLFLYLVIEHLWAGIFAVEILIAAVEAFIYSHTLTPKEPRRADSYAITANILSFLLGLPVWAAVMFIFRTN